MSSEDIRKHLRAAIDEVVNSEKKRLHDLFDESDARASEGIEKMKPLIQSINELKAEIGDIEGLIIKTYEHGSASVEIKSTCSYKSFSISTSFDNMCFMVEEFSSFVGGYIDHADKKTHNLQSPTCVLNLVVKAIGEHIASKQVFDERYHKT
jgi:hypothetical protein